MDNRSTDAFDLIGPPTVIPGPRWRRFVDVGGDHTDVAGRRLGDHVPGGAEEPVGPSPTRSASRSPVTSEDTSHMPT